MTINDRMVLNEKEISHMPSTYSIDIPIEEDSNDENKSQTTTVQEERNKLFLSIRMHRPSQSNMFLQIISELPKIIGSTRDGTGTDWSGLIYLNLYRFHLWFKR